MTTETYTYIVTYCTEDNDSEKTFKCKVTISADAPITDVMDKGADRFYDAVGDAIIIMDEWVD